MLSFKTTAKVMLDNIKLPQFTTKGKVTEEMNMFSEGKPLRLYFRKDPPPRHQIRHQT